MTSVLPDAAPANWVDRFAPAALRPWLKLGRFDRPTGIWLLMLPGWQGIALADAIVGRLPDPALLALFFVGAALMRAAGCAYNDIVDRDIDAKVARTAARPVASGRISVPAAWAFVVACSLASLAILLSLNIFAVALGVLSLALVAAYPFMKRITWWPQAWLGLTFNWGALFGFAAATGTLTQPAYLFYAGCFFWTIGYDIIYAHQDKEDDILVGVKSAAIRLGAHSKPWLYGFYAVAYALMVAGGWVAGLRLAFVLAMMVPGAHLLWQLRHLDIDRPLLCLKLFKSNRDTGALIAAALLFGMVAGV